MDYFSGNLVLIGFHACGKTSIGKILAQSLNRQFFDFKEEIEKRNSCTISDLTLIHGEKYVSALERELVAEISNSENVVVATTSNTVSDVLNVLKLRENSIFIHLKASNHTVFKNFLLESSYRDANDLNEFYDEAMSDITNQMNKMRKYYSCSDITLTVDNMTKEDIINELFISYEIYKNIYNVSLK